MPYLGLKPLDRAITSTDLEDGAVLTADIADGAITTAKLDDAAVTAAKVAAAGLGANTITAKAVGTAAIADAAITGAKVAAAGLGSNTNRQPPTMLLILKMGRMIAIAMNPTIEPMMMIMIGSIMPVTAFMARSTASRR